MTATIRSRLALITIFFCLQNCLVQAQQTESNWVLLTQASVSTNSDSATIALPEGGPRVLATRLLAKIGSINFKRLIVTYSNGQTHFEVRPNGRPINLEEGERTRLIDFREEGRVVESIGLTIESAASPTAKMTVEVWALRESAPRARASNRSSVDIPREANAGEDYVRVPVYFGTTREPGPTRTKNNRTLVSFSGEHGNELLLGRSLVTVPRDHKAGEITRPEFDLMFAQIAFRNEDPKRDFTIAAVDVMPQNVFLNEIRSHGAGSSRFRGQALVFVHGYNISFDDAMFRAAQISFDIGFDGPVVAFSWASHGGLLDYKHDVDTAKASRTALRQLIEMLAQDASLTAINIIAHSMGNDPLIDVLKEQSDILSHRGDTTDFKLNEIILAAPDVSRNIFEQSVTSITGLVRGGITLFASRNDVALILSKRVAGGLERAGDVPRAGILIIPGMDSIDISEASTGFLSLNHSAFADRAQLVTDMQQLFERTTGKRPPDLRSKSYRMQTKDRRMWWRYIKD